MGEKKDRDYSPTINSFISAVRLLERMKQENAVYSRITEDIYGYEDKKNAMRDLMAVEKWLSQRLNYKSDTEFLLFEIKEEPPKKRRTLCQLTKYGRIFLENVDSIPYMLRKMETDLGVYIEPKTNELQSRLTIGSIDTLALSRLPKIIKDFHQNNRLVSIRIKTGSSLDIKNWLEDHLIDIGFITESVDIKKKYSCDTYRLDEYPVWICPADYLEQGKSPHDLPVILFSEGTSWRKRMNRWLENTQFRILSEAANMEIIMAMVNEGLGRSIVPNTVIEKKKYSNVVSYKEIDEVLYTKIITKRSPNQIVKKFLEYCPVHR